MGRQRLKEMSDERSICDIDKETGKNPVKPVIEDYLHRQAQMGPTLKFRTHAHRWGHSSRIK